MGWCGKYSRQCKTMPSGPPEFIPLTGLKCSCGKISSPLTEIPFGKTDISGTEPARPLIWTHLKFYKGVRVKARSRTPGGAFHSIHSLARGRTKTETIIIIASIWNLTTLSDKNSWDTSKQLSSKGASWTSLSLKRFLHITVCTPVTAAPG